MPDQVARYWDFFKEGFKASLPPIAGDTEEHLNSVLEYVLAGGIVVWLSYTKKDTIQASGFICTQVIVDEVSKSKMLLLYAVYAPNGAPDNEWLEGIAALGEFGRSLGCEKIVAYTDNPAVIKRAEMVNGNTDWRFLSFEI
jgi:hypothetical protein